MMRKRWMPLLLTILLLSGCGAAASKDPASEAPPTAAVSSPAVMSAEIITYAVETKHCEETAAAEDGTPLVRFHFALPSLQVLSNGEPVLEGKTAAQRQALKTAEQFNARFEKWLNRDAMEEAISMAQDHYAASPSFFDGTLTYEEELAFTAYQAGHLVSISASYYSFLGGAHPNTNNLGWNFNLLTGEFLAVPAIAADGLDFQSAVAAEIVAQCREIAAAEGLEPESYFWEDYRNTAAHWNEYAVSFDENGMHVVFSPYDIACYAAGPQTFSFSYDWLRPYLGKTGEALLGLPEIN